MEQRTTAMTILQEEENLNEIVKLVGKDSLSAEDQMTLETAKMIREDFLQQNAFVDEDAYSSYDKQFRLLGMILHYDTLCREAMTQGAELNDLFNIPARELIGRAKMILPGEYEEKYAEIERDMKLQIQELTGGEQL
jgi:V/A-type H+-transporting ATPase subunit A